MDMELKQSVKLSIIFLICLCWRGIYAQVEWHVSDTFTLNTSSQSGSPVSRNSPGLSFYYDLSSWVNASSGIQNPYSYLCFISSHAHAFILSICTTSHNMGDNFDYHTPIVWSANRQTPAQGKLITLTLQADGDLVLQGDQDMAPVWSTGTGKKGVVRMQLLQFPINLVLYDTHNTVVWQSLDHPCDTLTAFQTLRAGMKLVSWASPNDPSEGHYSLVVGSGFVTLYTSSLYTGFQPIPYWNWSSPVLHDDIITVSGLGFLMTDTSTIVDLNLEGNLVLPCMPTTDQVNKTFLRLESDGILHLYTLTTLQWTDLCHIPSAQNCSLPNQCGPYGICSNGGNCACPTGKFFSPLNTSDLTAGCMLINKLPRCNESTHKTSLEMLSLPGFDYFSTSYSPPISDISSEDICQDTCLSNCSCVAALWHFHSLGCFHVHYQIGSLQASKNESLYRAYVKVRSPPSSHNHTFNRFKLGISIAASFLVFFAISVLIYWNTMKGTPGYLAPEWLKQTVIDEKSDVFSFGMLLLEIISGRKNLDVKQESPERIYYPEWAFMQAQGSTQIEAQLFTDAELHEEEEYMQARRMIKTAFLCLLEEPSLRPSMEQVILMLEGRLDVMSIQFSSLLQGLFFVLRNSTNYNLMQETLKHILAPIHVSATDPSFSCATMSLEISTR